MLRKTQLRNGQLYHGRSTTRHFAVEEHVALWGWSVLSRQFCRPAHRASRNARRSRADPPKWSPDLPPHAKRCCLQGFRRRHCILLRHGQHAGGPSVHPRWQLHDMSSAGVDGGGSPRQAASRVVRVPSRFASMGFQISGRRAVQGHAATRLLGETRSAWKSRATGPQLVVLHRCNHARDAEPIRKARRWKPFIAGPRPGRQGRYPGTSGWRLWL